MRLSQHERRMLAELEQALTREDPRFVQQFAVPPTVTPALSMSWIGSTSYVLAAARSVRSAAAACSAARRTICRQAAFVPPKTAPATGRLRRSRPSGDARLWRWVRCPWPENSFHTVHGSLPAAAPLSPFSAKPEGLSGR